MEDRHFEYDVAFSFQGSDERLATQLNDLLSDRLKTFIYSERQKELAGTDGQETFSAVYGKSARVVVIFYRKEYGQSPWTRVELTAIKNRTLEEGWDFTFIIPTEDKPSTPPWLPKTRLYAGLARWGLAGAAAAIEARVSEQGGNPHEESVSERAARFKRATELKDFKRQFASSDHGVKSAHEAYAAFSEALSSLCQTVAASGLAVKYKQDQQYRIISGLYPVNAVCSFQPRYSNDLQDAFLEVGYWMGFPNISGYFSRSEGRRLQSMKFAWMPIGMDRFAYVLKDGSREFSPERLADHVLKGYIEIADKTPRD